MRSRYKTVKVEFGNFRFDFLCHKTPPFPKVSLGRELQGGWVVPANVRKAWARRHIVGKSLQEMSVSERARDGYWRALVLAPEEIIPDGMKGYALALRSQLKSEFEAATRSGELQQFVTSFANALERDLSDPDGTDSVTRFLIGNWLNEGAPLCFFTPVALADFLSGIFTEHRRGLNHKALEKKCERLDLRSAYRQTIKSVIPLEEGGFLLRGN